HAHESVAIEVEEVLHVRILAHPGIWYDKPYVAAAGNRAHRRGPARDRAARRPALPAELARGGLRKQRELPVPFSRAAALRLRAPCQSRLKSGSVRPATRSTGSRRRGTGSRKAVRCGLWKCCRLRTSRSC